MSKTFKSFKSQLPRAQLSTQPGAICVVSNDRGTYPQFAASLVITAAPPGSFLVWQFASGGALAAARNGCVTQALARGAKWVWFIDDDHVYSPNRLQRLLSHNQDIVVPLISRRQPPFSPVIFAPFPVSSAMSDSELVEAAHKSAGESVDTRGKRGLLEMGHAGASGALIRADVFQHVAYPWFEFGKFGVAGAGEDTWLFLRARRAGFSVSVDLDTPIGHLTHTAVWPTRQADGSIGHELSFDFSTMTGIAESMLD